MDAIRALRALGPIDATNVRRDALLRWVLVLPLLFAVPVRWPLPRLLVQVEALLGVSITPHYVPLAGSMLVTIAPLMVGMVVGFLLLDQRDDGTLAALRVTPLAPGAYVTYRLAVPVVVSLALTLAMFPIAGLPLVDLVALVVASLVAAPLAPLLALVLATFAENKVQGFALTKATNAVLIAPFVAYFVAPPWQIAFGLVPSYWSANLVWLAAEGAGGIWPYAIAGLLLQGGLVALLLRRFDRLSNT